MNAERLHVISMEVQKEIDDTNLITNLQQLVNALENVVSQPQANYQQALGSALEEVYRCLSDVSSDSFSPAWRQILEEIGGNSILGNELKVRLEDIFERNQITPSVALEEVREISTALENYKTAVDNIISGFQELRIGAEELEPGECEIGLIVPRDAIQNRLDELGNELRELNFVFGTFSEVASSERRNFEIRTLSSSDLMIYLKAVPVVAACIAHAVERVIALYKQLLEIRKLKNDLEDQGIPKKNMKGIEDHANSMMDDGIEKLTLELIKEYYKGADNARRNELKNGVRISLNKIANRIDKGYNIEVRIEPLPEPEAEEEESQVDEELRQHISVIQNATKLMQFMKLQGSPILHLPESTEKKKNS